MLVVIGRSNSERSKEEKKRSNTSAHEEEKRDKRTAVSLCKNNTSGKGRTWLVYIFYRFKRLIRTYRIGADRTARVGAMRRRSELPGVGRLARLVRTPVG
ncbi:hypothetical protein BHM03_00059756 [Ensete ventricosum]|nr:hypothetical protein BHM03_00059756 [Ensete ventricosum]